MYALLPGRFAICILVLQVSHITGVVDCICASRHAPCSGRLPSKTIHHRLLQQGGLPGLDRRSANFPDIPGAAQEWGRNYVWSRDE
eukprot:6896698-Pyramimonas_sp.AAC.1